MRYRRTIARDPYETAARFASKCRCGAPITKGESIFYYPNTKTALGMKCGCGEDARREFEAAAFDESMF